jgi:hypothetical protein
MGRAARTSVLAHHTWDAVVGRALAAAGVGDAGTPGRPDLESVA